MTVAEFLTWSAGSENQERYELVRGEPLRLMAPTIIRHAQIQANIADKLRRPRIPRQGSISLAPPGLDLEMAALYRDTELADP